MCSDVSIFLDANEKTVFTGIVLKRVVSYCVSLIASFARLIHSHNSFVGIIFEAKAVDLIRPTETIILRSRGIGNEGNHSMDGRPSC